MILSSQVNLNVFTVLHCSHKWNNLIKSLQNTLPLITYVALFSIYSFLEQEENSGLKSVQNYFILMFFGNLFFSIQSFTQELIPKFCKSLIHLDHHHHCHYHHCSLSFTTFNYLPNILPQNIYLQVSFVFFLFLFFLACPWLPSQKATGFKPAACLMRVSFLQLSLSDPYGLYCNLIQRQRERKRFQKKEITEKVKCSADEQTALQPNFLRAKVRFPGQ